MNEGAPMMYHGSGFGGPAPVYMVPGQLERQTPRQYPLEVLQYMGGMSRGGSSPAPAAGTPRRSQPHRGRDRDRHPSNDLSLTDNTAFGYDSDDSSLSSNASGSNKSGDKGDGTLQSSSHSNSGVSVSSGSSGYSSGSGGPPPCPCPCPAPSSPPSSSAAAAAASREWRARTRREHQRPRRIAPDRYLNGAYPFQVKFTPDDLLNGSKWDTLSQEIWDKFVKSQQTEETFKNKMNLWRHLYLTIKSIFPRYGLYVVGSTMSGFGLDSSDMDLCLYVRPLEHVEPRAHAVLHLGFILNYLKGLDPSAVLIQAKVPILKFTDPRYGMQVDLNCNNVVGIKNTNLLHCYSRLDWRVRPLVVVTKLWASAHDINDARQKTLSSYSLTLMVIHFLQCGVSPAVLPLICLRGVAGAWGGWGAAGGVGGGAGVAGGGGAAGAGGGGVAPPVWGGGVGRPSRASLAELFLHLLRYYAHFPYDKMAVSVRLGQPVPIPECRAARSHKNDPHQWKLLCVEEPFDLTNTARSVYDPESFTKIVETFRDSYKRLSCGLRLADAFPPAGGER